MKIQKSKLLLLIILLLSLVISGCNTTEKTSQSNLDKTTGQSIKETVKIKVCLYADGSICNQTCCKTGGSCGDQLYSYRKCDISNGIWEFTQYKNSDCTGFCAITSTEKFENKKEIGQEAKKELVETKLPEVEKVITCSSGWKCKDTNYKGYQLLDCSWITTSYCGNGCIDGKCLPKNEVTEPVPTTSTFVSEIIDGDTIKLQGGEKIRLIGINTPEVKQYYYPEAKNKLKELVEGKIIKLEEDISNVDRYGRLLRYIYVDDLFVNLEMIRLGYAEAYKYPPDVKYSDLFEEAETEAKSEGLGIWKTSDYEDCIIVLEFHYKAEGNDNNNLNDEYVVLKNICPETINLTSWTIKDEATHIYTFSNFNLNADAQVTFYTGIGQDTSTELYWKKTGTAVWNNDGDTLFLRDKNGNLALEEKY
ncbi:MAG: thermonuclease family protein [Nanoarchaeota archaeon]